MIWLILLFGFVLRLAGLNQSLWLDEATSAIVARDFSISKILSEFSLGDFHPPLHYLLLKGWVDVFGSSEISLRLPSVIAGILTIYIVYLLTKRMFSKSVALFSAIFLTVNPLHIYYSQEARMYSLETLFATLAVWCLYNLVNTKKKIYWLYLTTASLLLLYTDYLPIFLIISLGIYLLFFEREFIKKNQRMWLVSLIGIAILYLPWLPSLLTQLKSGLLVKSEIPAWWAILGNTNFKQLVLVPIKFSIGRISAFNNVLYGLIVGPILLVYSAIFLNTRREFSKSLLIWFWLVGPIAFIAIFGLWISVFSYFRLLFVLPAFCILLAVGCVSIKGKLKNPAILFVVSVSVITSGIYLFNPAYHRENWKSAVAFIEENSKDKLAETIFVTDGQRDPYYYYSKSVPSCGPEGISNSFDTIWLVRYVQPIFDPEDKVRQSVEALGYQKLGEYDFNGVTIWRYEKTMRKACVPGGSICIE